MNELPSNPKTLKFYENRRCRAFKLALQAALASAMLTSSPFTAEAVTNTPIQQRNQSNLVLQRGINLPGWFNDWQPHTHQQYENYISGIPAQLQANGATYIRVWVNMGVFTRDSNGDINSNIVQEFVNDINEVEALGIGVLITAVPQYGVPSNQDIKTAAGQYFLNNFWSQFGSYLSTLNPNLTFPEPINEPVLPNTAAFNAFQKNIVATIRGVMPTNTIIATGNNWSGIAGLLDPNFQILADQNVIYAVHFYEPFILDESDVTTWASWEKTPSGQACAFSKPAADDKAVSNAPFPVTNVAACHLVAMSAPDACVQSQIDWYCNTKGNNSTPENTPALLLSRISQLAAWANTNGVIVADTELGIPIPHLQFVRLAWFVAVSAAFNTEGIGYSLWAYNDSYGFVVSQPPDFNVARSGSAAPALDQNTLCVFQVLNYTPAGAGGQLTSCESQ